MSQNELAIILLVFGTINISVIIGALAYFIHGKIKKSLRQKKVERFGEGAEKRVYDYLRKAFPRATVLKDVYLKTASGLTEIDLLFISNRGIFIIEVKSHNGYIVTAGKLWTQRWREKVVRFHSPVSQNAVHKNALEALFRKRQSLASLPIYTVTVFTSKTVSFSRNVKDVIKLSSLSRYIKAKKPDRRMTREMQKRVDSFISSNMETSRLRQARHRKKVFEENTKRKGYRINYR